MYKSICVVLIFFIYSSPIYASELSNQARDDIESIIYKAINQSGLGYKHVVGIVPPKIQRKIHRTKFYGLVEESMESIFASRSRLADRDRLKEIENKMELIEENGETADGAQLWLDGTTAFEGVPLSLLEGIDYFVWSNVKQISQEKVNIKISILEIKGLRSGIASGETKIDDILREIDVNSENYSKWEKEYSGWKEEYQSAIYWENVWKWTHRGTLVFSLFSIGLEENPTNTLFISASMVGAVIGTTLWWINSNRVKTLREKGIEKNYPLVFSIIPSNNKISLNVTYKLVF
ncbi:uncharacterized protein METZ01_LOCUS269515 [marine metagenome]|uniref:Uncharacterized protein n=1 Tax=marine metagenome TaxID=408172 RepID=A0A382K1V7_9ZZZZ